MSGLCMPVAVFYPQPQLKWSFWWDALGCKDMSLLPQVMETFKAWPIGSWKGLLCDGKSVRRCCSFIEENQLSSSLHQLVMDAFCRIAGRCPSPSSRYAHAKTYCS
jgi:hypothetical protein